MTNLEKLQAEADMQELIVGYRTRSKVMDKEAMCVATAFDNGGNGDTAASRARLIALAVNHLGACVELLERIAGGWGGTWGEKPEHPSVLASALLAAIEQEAGS